MDALIALLEKGGFVAPPLVLCALVLWYAVGYRVLLLRRGRDLVAGLTRRARGQMTPRALDVAVGEAEAELARYSTVIMAVVTVAPLLGLLGTVSGMIETFDALGDMALFSQAGGIAGGVSEALFSTQLGLTVAIPGLVAGRVLARRQQARVEELGQIRARLLEAA